MPGLGRFGFHVLDNDDQKRKIFERLMEQSLGKIVEIKIFYVLGKGGIFFLGMFRIGS